MSRNPAERTPLWQTLGMVATFAAMLIVGPVTALILTSWWPVLGGFVLWTTHLMLVIGASIVREHRRPSTFGGPISSEVLREMLAEAEERESKERDA